MAAEMTASHLEEGGPEPVVSLKIDPDRNSTTGMVSIAYNCLIQNAATLLPLPVLIKKILLISQFSFVVLSSSERR